LQKRCKEKGHPWEIAKGFDGSAAVSQFFQIEDIQDRDSINFSLKLNGDLVQQGNTRDLIFSFQEVIVHISRFFKLQEGDYLFTGTPVGVGPVKEGDRLEAFLEDSKVLECEIR
jgi:2-keto-4-pentenoate hydratase/2-oxohepta-3-ene-1,7-dioic acid hydratase in catechol pathway